MKGYLRVASIMPNIKVGNPTYNLDEIKDDIRKANTLNSKICVLPELSLTGLNLESLYYDNNLLNSSLDSLFNLLTFSTASVSNPIQLGLLLTIVAKTSILGLL